MRPQAMISSVTKDRLPLGRVSTLAGIWFEAEKLIERLRQAGFKGDLGSPISFDFIREEIRRHRVGKYGWDAYLFEDNSGEKSGERRRKTAILSLGFLVQALDGWSETTTRSRQPFASGGLR